jgi:V/A-type H+-transporting ATPase subunit I
MTVLRPANARWFELLTAREELASVLRCLAPTGQIELQAHTTVTAAHLLPALRAALDEYKRLLQRFAQFLPEASGTSADHQREPEEIATQALKQLRDWASAADPLVTHRLQLAHEQSVLQVLQELLAGSITSLPDLELLSRAGPLLASRAYLLTPDTTTLAVPPAVLVQRINRASRSFLLAVGPRDQIAALDDNLGVLKARRLDIPRRLPPGAAGLQKVTDRIREIATELEAIDSQLERLQSQHGVRGALADMQFIEWLVAHVPELALTEHFAWVTGWTSDLSGTRVQTALERAHVQHLLRFPDAPPDLPRPVVLHNLRWVQPFELFARLLGVPAASEADPSPIVALIAPLMFGFMFGDVGQGAVLLLAGLLLRRKYPAVALLIPGGMAAIAFGFLFGSVFAREDLIPALWIHPLERPLVLLSTGLAFGACVILAGMILDAVQHHWSGQAGRWWATRAGLVLGYLGILASVRDLRALWALPAGLAWSWIAAMVSAPTQRLKQLGGAIGESLETLLQVLVNTISFVRIGAFALAHAGLAGAINGIAAGIDSRPVSFGVLALGNVVVLVVEGLVVGIQTTRLILFEFFIRFLHGSGRPFRPLPLPGTPKHV